MLLNTLTTSPNIWDKVFRNGPSEVCGKQLLKNLKGYGLLKHAVLKAVFHIFHLVQYFDPYRE